MKINHPDQLGHLRGLVGLATIQVDADKFLAGNLPLYLFKYVVWAMADDGVAHVKAARTIDSMGIVPGAWSFQFLVQTACKAIEGIGVIIEVDIPHRTFTFKRSCAPALPSPWSAVVVYSGRKDELPLLDKCLHGLMRQKELTHGGQIVVCGPAEASDVVRTYEGVEYLPYETPIAAGRFLVGKKKNFAVAHLRHERVLICHSRIVLDEGCLTRIPVEFDVITPRIQIQTASGRQIPYLDLFFQKLYSTSLYSDRLPPFLGYTRTGWRRYLRAYHPYVDGGLFCVKKSLFISIPLSETVAWGEGEDVEWCRRLLIQGKIVELADKATAKSLVDKLNDYTKFGHIMPIRLAIRGLSHIQAFLRRIH